MWVSPYWWPTAASLQASAQKFFLSPSSHPFWTSLWACDSMSSPRKKQRSCPSKKGSPSWLPETLGHGLCASSAFHFCVLISVYRNICSHTLDDIQCMHPWTSSIHLHRKNSPLLLSTPTQASSCNTACSQSFVNTIKLAWQRGSANSPKTHKRAHKMELHEMCLLRALQTLHKSTITARGKHWHYAGLTSELAPPASSLTCKEYRGIQLCEPQWLVHWGLLLSTASSADCINTARPSTLFYPSTAHWHKKVILSEKWAESGSFMENNTLFQPVPLQSRCLWLFMYQALLMFGLQINICLAFNSLTLTVPCSHLQHHVE